MAPAQKKMKLDRETWLIVVVVCIGMIISLSGTPNAFMGKSKIHA